MIDVEQQIFQFEGHKFLAFFVEKDEGDWDVFIKGSQIAKYLEYVDTDQAIHDHVDNENKYKYSKLCEFFDSVKNTGLKNIHSSTTFVNLFCEFIRIF